MLILKSSEGYGCLQVLPPGDNALWCCVKPLPNHCIVKFGDAVVIFMNGLLRSNIYRIISPPGEQAEHTRYSLVYFARPEDDVLLKRLESEVIPALAEGEEEEAEVVNAKDWIIRRAISKRVGSFRRRNGRGISGLRGLVLRVGCRV